MRNVELAGTGALDAPFLEVLAGFVEFHNAIVRHAAMAVGDENIAIGRDQYIGRHVERVVAAPGDSSLAEAHQHLSVRAELDDLKSHAALGLTVGHPDIAVAVHADA